MIVTNLRSTKAFDYDGGNQHEFTYPMKAYLTNQQGTFSYPIDIKLVTKSVQGLYRVSPYEYPTKEEPSHAKFFVWLEKKVQDHLESGQPLGLPLSYVSFTFSNSNCDPISLTPCHACLGGGMTIKNEEFETCDVCVGNGYVSFSTLSSEEMYELARKELQGDHT